MNTRGSRLVPAIAGLAVMIALCAWGEEKADKERAEGIGARMNAAFKAWQDQPEDARPPLRSVLRDFVETLSAEEIRLAGKFRPDDGFDKAIFRKWATIDHEEALREARKVEDVNAARIRNRGNGLEGNPGEAMSAYIFPMYLGAVEGWAMTEPKKAWEAFKKEEGAFARSLVLEDFTYPFYESLLESLARADPDFAFEELMTASLRQDGEKEVSEEFNKAHLLAGYLRGAPKGRNWAKEVHRLLERQWKVGEMYYQIRVGLLGRWLEDAPAAAEKWFREGKVEGLHWDYVDPPDPFALRSDAPEKQASTRKRYRHDLGGAAGYWAARDFIAAWNWMKSSEGFQGKGFDLAALRGASASLNDPWSDAQMARAHFRKQLGTLPDQRDRDRFALRFASELWVFDNTRLLGEPAPDAAPWLDQVKKKIASLRLSGSTSQKILAILKKQAPRDRNDPFAR